jgi:hypothetical protein
MKRFIIFRSFKYLKLNLKINIFKLKNVSIITTTKENNFSKNHLTN